MRKTRTGQKLWAAVSALCFIALFTTCKNGIGLGSTIDIKPPTIENNGIYPPNNAIIKGPFTLAVKADDDTSVTAVAVVITTADAYNSKINIGNSFLKAPSSDEDWWTLNIDPQGRYPISDGVYNMEIQATDTAGKVTTRTSSFTIDNAPPLLILNRPSTAALNPSGTYSDGDAFGVDFWLVGQVYDKSDVAKLRITAKAVGSGTEYTKELEHIPQNIRLKIDSFSAGGGNFYNNLYGGNTENGKKNFSYTVRVYDSARTYTAPGESSGAGEGNYTDVYYRSDDLYEKVLSKPKNKIQDVYAVLYNMPSAITDPTDIQTIKDEFNAVDKKIGGGDGQRVGTFALNPSMNPCFEIHGSDPSKEVSGLPDPNFPDLYSGTILSVKLSRNLDGVPFEEIDPTASPVDDAYQFFLAEWEKYKDVYSKPAFDINDKDALYDNLAAKTLKPGLAGLFRIERTSVGREGGNYIIGIPVQQGNGLEYGKRYVLLVQGADKKGNVFRANPKEKNGDIYDIYGIYLKATGRAPTVSVTKINGKNTADAGQIYVKKDLDVSVKAKLSAIANLTIKLKKMPAETVVHQEVLPNTPTDTDIVIPRIDSLPSAPVPLDGNYQLVVQAEKDGLIGPESVYHIVCDTAAPVVRIVYPGNNTKLNEDSKLLEISGTAFDAGAGLKANPVSVTLEKTAGDGSPRTIPVGFTNNGESWGTNQIDLSQYKEGVYKITAKAEDALGQLTDPAVTRTFTYDDAPPEITGPLSVNGKPVVDGTVTVKESTVTVTGSIKETYGIAEVTFSSSSGVFDPVTPPAAGGLFAFSASGSSLAEGDNTVTIRVKDKAGKEISKHITIKVDTQKPALPELKIAGKDRKADFKDSASSAALKTIVVSSTPVPVDGIVNGTGSLIEKVEYQLEGQAGWTDLPVSAGAGSFSGSLPIPKDTRKKVTLKTIDKAGNEEQWQAEIKVTSETLAVRLDVTDPNPNDKPAMKYRKHPFKVKIGAWLSFLDDSTPIPVSVVVTKAEHPIPNTDFFENDPAGIVVKKNDDPTECAVKTSLADGEYKIKVSAEVEGKSVEKSVTVMVDTKAPMLTPRVPAEGQALREKQPLFAAISDLPGIGIESVTAVLNNSEGTDQPIAVSRTGSSVESTGVLDLAEGENTVVFTCKDKLGNEKIYTVHCTFDQTPPVLSNITINGKSSEKVWIGVDSSNKIKTVKIKGKVKDTNKMKAVKITVTKSGSSWGSSFLPLLYNDAAEHTWEQQIEDSQLNGSGRYTVSIIAEDAAGLTTAASCAFEVDADKPDVSFISPTAGTTVNKTVMISGKASDKQELKSVKIVKEDGSELTGVSESFGTVSTKAEFSGDRASRWSFKLNTADYVAGSGALVLKAVATDIVGNIKEQLLTLTVNQDFDRPQIVITNLTSLGSSTYLTADTLNFVIIDDDGEIEDGKFEITSVPPVGGTPLQKTVSGWQYTFDTDGQKTLTFKVIDKQGSVFETNAADSLNKPRVYAKDTATIASDAPVVLKVDTKLPQSETPAIQFSQNTGYTDLTNLEQNAKFKDGMLYLQVMASDSSGIRSITGKIDDVTSMLVQSNVDSVSAGNPEKWQIQLDLNPVSEGIKTLTVELTDNAGAKSQFTRTIIVDKTAPKVELNYPDPTDPQAGEITVSGIITDVQNTTDAGVGVNPDKTKYILGKQAVPPTVDTPNYDAAAAPNGWKAMDTSTKGSWSVRVNLEAVPSSGYGGTVGSYKEIPLYIFTEDEIGNKTVHEKKILFDPDGTKPIVKVSSPQKDATVGGTIQIFGTASAPKGGAGAVDGVYIWFSHSGNFTNDSTDGTFGSTDWCNNGMGQSVTIDTGAGAGQDGPDWRISINGDNSFNHATDQNQTVYFKLRAKNRNGTMGDWSEKRKIIVDKDAPLITDIKIDNETGASSPQDYGLNMWLKSGKKLTAKLIDPSGIQNVKITFMNGGVEKKYQKKDALPLDAGFEAVPAGWLTDYNSGGKSGYELNLPLNITGMSGDSFSVMVEIKERAAQQLSSRNSFLFRFDTENPVGDFGTDKYMSIGNFASSSITDMQLAQKVTALGATASSGGGCKILAENSLLTVTAVTGNKVEFTASPALTAGSYSYILYKPETLIYKNSGGKWIINGAANDSGSGVHEVKAKVSVNGVFSSEVIMTETGAPNKIARQLGGTVTWQGEIDFGSVPDGKGELHYEITDKSGNKYSVGDYSKPSPTAMPTVSAVGVVVKNNPIKVSKITLKTEIGGQTVKTDDPDSAEPKPYTTQTESVDAHLDQTKTVVSKNFAFKSKTDSKIKVEYAGGQGTVKYRLKKGDGTTVLQPLTAIASGGEIDLKNHLTAIGNSDGVPTKIMLELWDEAYGFTPGTDSAWAKVEITTFFDALDTTPPTVVILPFYWNGEGQDAKGNPLNSLYEGSRDNGHVEIGAISGQGDYSSVSGKVNVSGFAYDNVELKKITATLPNNSALTVTATRQADGTWASDKTMSTHGAALTVTGLGTDYLGHYVAWRLDWNTENTSVGTGTQHKEIVVKATDGSNNTSADTNGTDMPQTSTSLLQTAIRKTSNTELVSDYAKLTTELPASVHLGQFVVLTGGETQYLTRIKALSTDRKTVNFNNEIPVGATTVSIYRYTASKTETAVNVVPYIREIVTESTHESGLTGNTIRSSEGKYSVIKGNTAGFIKVNGFNLSNPTVRLVNKTDLSTAAVASGTGLSHSGSSDTAFSLSNNLNKSGYLEVFAGTAKVRAINNINSNEKAYNKEEDLYLLKNKNFNDDRYLRVFDMKETRVRNGYYPEMIMDGNDPVFGYIDLRGGPPSGAGTYKPSHAMPQRAKFKHDDGTVLNKEYLIKASIWDQMGMARDAGGRYYHLTTYDRADAAMSFIYDKYAKLYTSGKGWGSGTGYSDYGSGGNWSHDPNNNALTLENLSYGDGLLLGRYQYPKLIAKGDSTSPTEAASVYIAYYDANTANKEIIFRNLQIGQYYAVSGTRYQLYSGLGYNQYTNLKENTGNSETYNTGRQTAASSASQYFDLGVTSDKHVVLVYFDEAAGKLKLRYSDTAVDGSNPTGIINWTTSTVDFPKYTGTYVSMDIDSSDGIHIAAFDSSNGDLKYFYLDSYNAAALKTALVDAAFSVGQWTQIKVFGNKPYIAYYNNSEAGQRSAIKLAYANDPIGTVKNGVGTSKKDDANKITTESYYENGFVTGRWECMTVPTLTPAQGGTPKFKKVNLGFDTAGRPVLGYLGSNIEFGKWLNE